MNVGDFKLCYIKEGRAYFTTQPLEEQWGDDWDDAPYEHNSGTPYTFIPQYIGKREPWSIADLFFEGPFDEPCGWERNSPWSVENINAGKTPWLKPARYDHDHATSIYAGTTLPDFIDMVEAVGGVIYLPRKAEWRAGLKETVTAGGHQ